MPKIVETGRPAKVWGAQVPNTSVEIGDVVTVVTQTGKQWDAKVTFVIRRTKNSSIVLTESKKESEDG